MNARIETVDRGGVLRETFTLHDVYVGTSGGCGSPERSSRALAFDLGEGRRIFLVGDTAALLRLSTELGKAIRLSVSAP